MSDTTVAYFSPDKTCKLCVDASNYAVGSILLQWSIERLNVFLYGKHFHVFVDHQPLKFIFGPRNKGSPRVERWHLKLQGYNFDVTYKKEAETYQITYHVSIIQQYRLLSAIKLMNTSISSLSMTLEEIMKETDKDQELSDLKNRCKKYKRFVHEFAEHDGVILRCNRIVIPETIQKRTLDIVKAKQMLRSKVYLYNKDKEVKTLIKTCIACQAV